MEALPLFALACVGIAIAIGAFWVGGKLSSARARLVLASSAALATPMAWLAVLALADQFLRATAPASAMTFASYVGIGVVLLAVACVAAALVPERVVWPAAAVVPVVTVVLASVQPATTAGGIVTVLLALTLLAAAAILPRAAALSIVDRSRAFVGIFAVITLLIGGGFGVFLGAAAVEERALGLSEASRDWRLEVVPDFEGEYRIVVPFPRVDAANASGEVARVAGEWRGHARVVDGRGAVSFLEGGDGLEIVARGPIVAQARYLFHASEDARTNVSAFVLPDVPVTLHASVDNATARVHFVVTAADAGAPCASREAEVLARVDEPAEAPGGRALWPEATC